MNESLEIICNCDLNPLTDQLTSLLEKIDLLIEKFDSSLIVQHNILNYLFYIAGLIAGLFLVTIFTRSMLKHG